MISRIVGFHDSPLSSQTLPHLGSNSYTIVPKKGSHCAFNRYQSSSGDCWCSLLYSKLDWQPFFHALPRIRDSTICAIVAISNVVISLVSIPFLNPKLILVALSTLCSWSLPMLPANSRSRLLSMVRICSRKTRDVHCSPARWISTWVGNDFFAYRNGCYDNSRAEVVSNVVLHHQHRTDATLLTTDGGVQACVEHIATFNSFISISSFWVNITMMGTANVLHCELAGQSPQLLSRCLLILLLICFANPQAWGAFINRA